MSASIISKVSGSRLKAKSADASGALNRGLLLLEHIAQSGRNGVTLTDLALQAGFAVSTTHRLLTTLEQMDFVRKDPELGLWYIGLRTFSVGNAFLDSRDVVMQARPFMKRLMERTGETVNLTIENEGAVVYIAQIECVEMMRMIVRLGSQAPIHASAAGKAMMAWMNIKQVEKALHYHGLLRLTPQTLTTMAALHKDLEQARRHGYACDLEEHTIGLHCVASPIFNEHGEPIAGLSLSGPKARVTDERLPELGLLINNCATEITKAIGGHIPDNAVKLSLESA